MERLNCPNCGAPIEIESNKCPYCGTYYFDLSCIDIDGQEPFYLKLKSNNIYFTQLVRPILGDMTFRRDEVYAYGGVGNEKRIAFSTGGSLTIDLTLEAIPNKKGVLTIASTT